MPPPARYGHRVYTTTQGRKPSNNLSAHQSPTTLQGGIHLSLFIDGNMQYISASRRTDLPRFFYRQFFDAWRRGEITYDGGYGRSYTVSLRPADVRGYIFWSKDYRPFIEHSLFEELIRTSNAVFGFTINDIPELEPGVAPLEQRLETAAMLCDRVGAERVLWRYDPICRFVNCRGKTITTDRAFYRLLPRLQALGITRCYFSFMALYSKTRSRQADFLSIPAAQRFAISESMLEAARTAGVRLCNCCNPEIPQNVPGVEQAHCVDESLLSETDRFGVHQTLKPKPTREGCGCYESRDIGSYNPPCPHGCLYCYANPALHP